MDDTTIRKRARQLGTALIGLSIYEQDAKIEEILRQTYIDGMMKASLIADTFSKAYGVEWWRTSPKTEVAAQFCRDVADKIRQQAKEIE